MLGIINARIETISQGTIEKGSLIIKEGKIFDLGVDIDVSGCEKIIDAGGRTVTPGIIDAHSHAGLHESGIGWAGDDTNEYSNPITPWCSVRDGINMQDMAFEGFRRSGITSLGVVPGSANIIGGTGLALKLRGTIVDEAVIKDPIGMKAAFGENPKSVYGNNKKSPATRMATAALFREALQKAKEYSEKLKELEKDKGLNEVNEAGEAAEEGKVKLSMKRDKQHEAMLPVINGEIPLLIHCHRHDDIVTAVRICNEFGVKFALEHVTDGHLIIDFLKKQNTHCAVGPTLHYGSKVENRHRDFKTPVYFSREGIPFSFTKDHPVVDARNLIVTAGVAVQWGMSEESALRAITLGSAEHIGIQNRVGSLEIGKDADLVVWSGNPLEFTTFADITIIDGQVVYEREVAAC